MRDLRLLHRSGRSAASPPARGRRAHRPRPRRPRGRSRRQRYGPHRQAAHGSPAHPGAGAEAAQHRLQLRRQLVVTRAQLHNRWRDRRLRGSAGAAARRIQLALGLGQRVAGARHVLGQQADLLAVEPRVHALHQPVSGRGSAAIASSCSRTSARSSSRRCLSHSCALVTAPYLAPAATSRSTSIAMLTAAAAITGSSAVNETSRTCDAFTGATVSAACTACSVALRAGSSAGPGSSPAGGARRGTTARWIVESTRPGHDGGRCRY